MDPSSVAFMWYEDDYEDLCEAFEQLELDQQQFIFWPVNDNTDKFQISGGSHWALLVYVQSIQKFYYIDSSSHINTDELRKKLTSLINKDQDVAQESFETIVLKNVSKQTNPYDWGVYVLANTEYILNLIKEGNFDGIYWFCI